MYAVYAMQRLYVYELFHKNRKGKLLLKPDFPHEQTKRFERRIVKSITNTLARNIKFRCETSET